MTARRAAAFALLCGCGSSVTTVRLPSDRDAARDAALDAALDAPPLTQRYAWGASAPSCYASMGRVELADGRWCTGVLVGPARVLTAESCLRGPAGARHLLARDVGFRLHGAERAVPAQRVAHLRDADDDAPAADLAVLTLAARVLVGDSPAPVAAVRDGEELPDAFTLASYVDSNTLGVSAPCAITRDDGASFEHGCALDGASRGGALIECAGGRATVYGIDPRGGVGAVSVRGLNALPLNPRSVALGPGADGRPVAYAYDDDTARLHVRQRGAARWGPWRALPDARSPDGQQAGAITAFGLYDGETSMVFHERGAGVQYRWALNRTGEAFSGWFPSFEAPGARRLVAVASAGAAGETAQVFGLGDRGEVVTQYKTSPSSGATVSPWCSLGRVPGATRIAAVSFPSAPMERTYQVFAATPSGVVSRWTESTRNACDLWFSALWWSLDNGLAERVAAIGAGVLHDGRPFVLSVVTSGQIRYTARLADGTAWERDAPFPVAGIVREVAVGRFTDEPARDRAAVLAVAGEGGASGTSPGELLYLEESSAGGFSGARWRRFYR